MNYLKILIKTSYSRNYLEQQKKEIETELTRNPELTQVKSKINNIDDIETHLEIVVWTLNNQMINQELEKNILTKIRTILGVQFILSIEAIYQ